MNFVDGSRSGGDGTSGGPGSRGAGSLVVVIGGPLDVGRGDGQTREDRSGSRFRR
jgi:hypothetical protein